MKIDKGFLLIGIIAIFTLCFISFGSAELFQFDNVKQYDSINKEVTIVNTFGIGGDIAKVKLLTPLHVVTGYGGYFKIGEIQVTNYKDYTNPLEKIDSFSVQDLSKDIGRTFEYKVKTLEDVVIEDYKTICPPDNKTACYQEKTGSHTERKEVLTPLEKTEFTAGEILDIEIWTYVYKDDYIEWIPTYYGVKIDEWASFSASLKVNLFSYYKLDDLNTQSTAKDELGNHDGTANPKTLFGTTGKINNAVNLTTTDVVYLNNTLTNFVSLSHSGSVSLWVKFNAEPMLNRQEYIWYHNPSGDDRFWIISQNGNILNIGCGDGSVGSNSTIVGGTWYNVVMVWNGASCWGYINGVVAMQYTYAFAEFTNNNQSSIGRVGQPLNAVVDELGMWTRRLTPTEITDLYNGGLGLPYEDLTITPAVTLNSPSNYYNATNPAITFNVTATDNVKIANVTLYIDGVLNDTDTSQINGTYLFNKTLSEGFHNWSILAYNNNSISNQNETRFLWVNTTPQLVLTAPDNYANLTYGNIFFNATATAVYDIANVTLYINGTATAFDDTGISGGYTFSVSLAEGFYNWSMRAYSSHGGAYNQSATRLLNIDLSFPVINVIIPSNNSINYTNFVTSNILNASIVWTASDVNLDKCFLSNISTGANITGTCNNLNNTFYVPAGTYNFWTYANDTFGRYTEKLTRVSFFYKIFEINQTYNSNATEYNLENFYANAYINSAFSVSSVLFNYNGTNYSASSSGIANYTRFAKTNFQLPVIGGNANNTFSWFVTLNDSSVIELTTNTQQENNLSFGSCATYPVKILNYSLVDEKTQSTITGTIETNIQIKTKDELTTIYNWTSSTTGTTTSLCSNVPLASGDYYKVYGTIRYYSVTENYSASIEYYNYLNYSLDSLTQYLNTTLYDLNVTESTDFQLTFKDSSFRTRENILIYVYRQYVPSGDFKIVEIPKTDSNGQTIVHLVRNDVVYNLIAVDSAGNILGNLNNVLAFCQDYTIGDCVINFQGTTAETGLEDYLSDVGISYSLSYSNTTNLISLTFLSSNTTARNVRMEVISSAIVTNRTICDTSLSAVTGTLTCDVSSLVNTTASVNVKIYVNGVQKIQDSLSFDSSSHSVTGLIFFGFILLLMVGIFFIESKEGVIIGVILSFILLVTLGIVRGRVIGNSTGELVSSAVLWLIVVGIILLFKLNGEKQ